MGRYTSVQAYADNNANVRSIPYEQATGGAAGAGKKSVVTEKVSNPYGSTAGAGSGEFHVYRHARAREAARWQELDAAQQQAELEEQFQQELSNAQDEEQLKTEKRRKKRQREKEAKQRKKNLKVAGILDRHHENYDKNDNSNEDDEKNSDAGDEFSYKPELEKAEPSSDKQEGSGDQVKQEGPLPVDDWYPNSHISTAKLRLSGDEDLQLLYQRFHALLDGVVDLSKKKEKHDRRLFRVKGRKSLWWDLASAHYKAFRQKTEFKINS